MFLCVTLGKAYFDVAVITIAGGPVNLHDFTLPVCLPSGPIYDVDHYRGEHCLIEKSTSNDMDVSLLGDLVTLTGYGQVSRNDKTVDRLRRASLTVFSQAYCNSTHAGQNGVIGRNVQRSIPNLFQGNLMCAGKCQLST